jgi:hypothetical protein
MDAKQAIKMNIDMAAMVCDSYLTDLSDDELMKRPHPGCNHLKWQLGHLISSEHQMVSGLLPGAMPALPEGFAEKYSKETAASDDAAAFDSKEVLMSTYQQQRAATLAALEAFPADQLEEPGPEAMRAYAPTKASVFSMQGSHWMMHAGQWVPIRRECGKDVVI